MGEEEEGATTGLRGEEEEAGVLGVGGGGGLWGGGGELPFEEQESRSIGSSSCMNTCNKQRSNYKMKGEQKN